MDVVQRHCISNQSVSDSMFGESPHTPQRNFFLPLSRHTPRRPKNISSTDFTLQPLPLGLVEGPITSVAHADEAVYVGTASGKLYVCEANWRLPARMLHSHWDDLPHSCQQCLDQEKSRPNSSSPYVPCVHSFAVRQQRSVAHFHGARLPSEAALSKLKQSVSTTNINPTSAFTSSPHLHCPAAQLPSAITHIVVVPALQWLLVLCNHHLCIYHAQSLAYIDTVRPYPAQKMFSTTNSTEVSHMSPAEFRGLLTKNPSMSTSAAELALDVSGMTSLQSVFGSPSAQPHTLGDANAVQDTVSAITDSRSTHSRSSPCVLPLPVTAGDYVCTPAGERVPLCRALASPAAAQYGFVSEKASSLTHAQPLLSGNSSPALTLSANVRLRHVPGCLQSQSPTCVSSAPTSSRARTRPAQLQLQGFASFFSAATRTLTLVTLCQRKMFVYSIEAPLHTHVDMATPASPTAPMASPGPLVWHTRRALVFREPLLSAVCLSPQLSVVTTRRGALIVVHDAQRDSAPVSLPQSPYASAPLSVPSLARRATLSLAGALPSSVASPLGRATTSRVVTDTSFDTLPVGAAVAVEQYAALCAKTLATAAHAPLATDAQLASSLGLPVADVSGSAPVGHRLLHDPASVEASEETLPIPLQARRTRSSAGETHSSLDGPHSQGYAHRAGSFTPRDSRLPSTPSSFFRTAPLPARLHQGSEAHTVGSAGLSQRGQFLVPPPLPGCHITHPVLVPPLVNAEASSRLAHVQRAAARMAAEAGVHPLLAGLAGPDARLSMAAHAYPARAAADTFLACLPGTRPQRTCESAELIGASSPAATPVSDEDPAAPPRLMSVPVHLPSAFSPPVPRVTDSAVADPPQLLPVCEGWSLLLQGNEVYGVWALQKANADMDSVAPSPPMSPTQTSPESTLPSLALPPSVACPHTLPGSAASSRASPSPKLAAATAAASRAAVASPRGLGSMSSSGPVELPTEMLARTSSAVFNTLPFFSPLATREPQTDVAASSSISLVDLSPAADPPAAPPSPPSSAPSTAPSASLSPSPSPSPSPSSSVPASLSPTPSVCSLHTHSPPSSALPAASPHLPPLRLLDTVAQAPISPSLVTPRASPSPSAVLTAAHASSTSPMLLNSPSGVPASLAAAASLPPAAQPSSAVLHVALLATLPNTPLRVCVIADLDQQGHQAFLSPAHSTTQTHACPCCEPSPAVHAAHNDILASPPGARECGSCTAHTVQSQGFAHEPPPAHTNRPRCTGYPKPPVYYLVTFTAVESAIYRLSPSWHAVAPPVVPQTLATPVSTHPGDVPIALADAAPPDSLALPTQPYRTMQVVATTAPALHRPLLDAGSIGSGCYLSLPVHVGCLLRPADGADAPEVPADSGDPHTHIAGALLEHAEAAPTARQDLSYCTLRTLVPMVPHATLALVAPLALNFAAPFATHAGLVPQTPLPSRAHAPVRTEAGSLGSPPATPAVLSTAVAPVASFSCLVTTHMSPHPHALPLLARGSQLFTLQPHSIATAAADRSALLMAARCEWSEQVAEVLATRVRAALLDHNHYAHSLTRAAAAIICAKYGLLATGARDHDTPPARAMSQQDPPEPAQLQFRVLSELSGDPAALLEAAVELVMAFATRITHTLGAGWALPVHLSSALKPVVRAHLISLCLPCMLPLIRAACAQVDEGYMRACAEAHALGPADLGAQVLVLSDDEEGDGPEPAPSPPAALPQHLSGMSVTNLSARVSRVHPTRLSTVEAEMFGVAIDAFRAATVASSPEAKVAALSHAHSETLRCAERVWTYRVNMRQRWRDERERLWRLNRWTRIGGNLKEMVDEAKYRYGAPVAATHTATTHTTPPRRSGPTQSASPRPFPLCSCTPFHALPQTLRALLLAPPAQLPHQLLALASSGCTLALPACSCALPARPEPFDADRHVDMSPYLNQFYPDGKPRLGTVLSPRVASPSPSPSPSPATSRAPSRARKPRFVLAADDLLPLLCWVILRAQLSLPGTHARIASLAIDGKDATGRNGYICTSTDIAVHHVSSLRVAADGTVSEITREMLPHARHHCPSEDDACVHAGDGLAPPDMFDEDDELGRVRGQSASQKSEECRILKSVCIYDDYY